MILSKNSLFTSKYLHDIFQGQLNSIPGEIEKLPKERFLANSDEQITNYLLSIFEIIPLKIDRSLVERTEPKEINLQRQGPFSERISYPSIEVDITIPFTGNSELWKCRPSSFSYNPPRGEILKTHSNGLQGVLTIKVGYYHDEFKGENVNKEIEDLLNSVDSNLRTIESDIEKHSKKMEQEIRDRVHKRRERLNAILEQEKSIEIPVTKRRGAPDFTELPIVRKEILSLKERTESEESYSISDSTYEHILELIRHQGSTFERTPKTYFVHNEEELRDILLAQLNGYFQGRASGETFRNNGKTDICIEEKNRAAFIAECKVWDGDKKILDAIDQMLGYLTWRDVKTALIVFNKDVAGFSELMDRIPQIIRSHPKFISIQTNKNKNEWELIVNSAEDNGRKIKVLLFMFNLFYKQN
jgi:hypothetical protein